MRVTFATGLVNAGIDPKTAQRLLRHKSVETTSRFYTKVCQHGLRPAVEAVRSPALDSAGPVADSVGSGNKVETLGGEFERRSKLPVGVSGSHVKAQRWRARRDSDPRPSD